MKKGLLTITALSLAVLLTACVTTIPNGLVEKNDLPPPQTTEAIIPETTEAIVPETTEAIVPETTEYIPEETQAQEPTVAQTEPKPTEPKPTEPKPTEPKPTEPKPTEPKPTEPKPTEPKPTEPKPTEPKPTEPKPTEVSKKLVKPAEAKTIAFQHAKVKAADAREVEVELDKEKNSVHYDVSFEVGNTDYEYEIEAYTGEVLRHEKEAEKQPEKPKPTEPKPTEPAVTTPQIISEEEAKTVAFNHAGVKASQVTHAEVKRDRDDGKTYYDISFIAGNTEYEYEIEVKSGNILHYEKEVKPAAKKTVAEAKAIALNHAGVKEADARELEVETDTQKGKTVYEIAFSANGYEYEYVIDGLSGEILQKEKELAD